MKLKDLKENYPLIHRVASSYVDVNFVGYEKFLREGDLIDAFDINDTEEGRQYWLDVMNRKNLQEKEEYLIEIVNKASKYWTVNTPTFNYVKVIKIEGMNNIEAEYIDIIQEDYPKNNFIRIPKHTLISVIKKIDKEG